MSDDGSLHLGIEPQPEVGLTGRPARDIPRADPRAARTVRPR